MLVDKNAHYPQRPVIFELSFYYYSREGHLEVAGMNCIQCLVGQVRDGNEWTILDPSDASACPVFITDKDSSWQCPPSSLPKQPIHQALGHLCYISPQSPTGYSTFIHIFSSSIKLPITLFALAGYVLLFPALSSYLIWSFTFDLFALMPWTPTYTDS